MRVYRSGGLVAVLVLAAFAAGGCGDSGDDDGASASAETSPQFVATGSDEEQIEQILHEIQEDFDRGDGAAYCDKVTEEEQQDIIGFGRNFNKGSTCSGVIDTVAQESKLGGAEQKPTRFIAARVNGDRARVRVRNGPRAPEWMVFVREDGQWKIVESGFDPDPIGQIQREQAQKEKDGGTAVGK